MNDELTEKIEKIEMVCIPNRPAAIQFIETLHDLLDYFEERGLTKPQIEKAFAFCLTTRNS